MANGSPNILERAGHINLSGDVTEVLSSAGDGVVRRRLDDPQFQTEITCVFPVATRATIAAIQAFCAEYRTGAFDFVAPDAGVGGSPTIQCELVDRPDIQRHNARTASVTVRIRRTLLADT